MAIASIAHCREILPAIFTQIGQAPPNNRVTTQECFPEAFPVTSPQRFFCHRASNCSADDLVQGQPVREIQPDDPLNPPPFDRHGSRIIPIQHPGFSLERAFQVGKQFFFSRFCPVGLPLDFIQLHVGTTELFSDQFPSGGFATAASADDIDSLKVQSFATGWFGSANGIDLI